MKVKAEMWTRSHYEGEISAAISLEAESDEDKEWLKTARVLETVTFRFSPQDDGFVFSSKLFRGPIDMESPLTHG